ncbi:MAG: hypothetical protein P4L31_04295 [Candidatus Babeliales bacterium]|nr:hypothetical protein [Candidatus Babeliales bacterium]
MINKYGSLTKAALSVMIISTQSFAAQPAGLDPEPNQQQAIVINDLMRMAGPFTQGEQFLIKNSADNECWVTVEDDSLIVKNHARLMCANGELRLPVFTRKTVLNHEPSSSYALSRTISTHSCDLTVDRNNRQELIDKPATLTLEEAENIKHMTEPRTTYQTRKTLLGKSVICGTATIGVLGLSAALYAKAKKSHS